MKFKNYLPILLYLAISLYFAVTWLPGGVYLGGGDVGIPTLNVERILDIVSSSWWDNQGTGSVNPVSFTAIPLYVFFNLLGKFIDPSGIQKAFFFLINLISALSVYFIARELKFNKTYSFLAGLLYISNFFVLTVWHRGVHNAMLFLAFLPLTFLFLIKGVRRKRFRYAVSICLASFIFSYVYGSPAFIFSIWLVWGSFILWQLAFNNGNRKFVVKFALLLFLSWVVTNLWWMVHFFEGGRYVFGSIGELSLRSSSSEVLLALKNQTRLTEVFRGISEFQVIDNRDWGGIYDLLLFEAVLWLPFTLFFIGVLSVKNSKRGSIKSYFILLFIIVVFIAKGVNPPFGWINKSSYDLIPYLILLRNPYEKVGLILALPYSIIIVFALKFLYEKKFNISFPKQIKRTILAVIVLLLLVSAWPLWTGKTYMGTEDSLIKVPKYYTEADGYLMEKNKVSSQRILHLPLPQGEAVDYDWGYSGIEPSQLFFGGSSISYKTGIPAYDKQVEYLRESVRYQDEEGFRQLIQNLNIGWIVLHSEVEWKQRNMNEPNFVNEWLEGVDYLSISSRIGPLSIWKVDSSVQKEKIHSLQVDTRVNNLADSDITIFNLTDYFLVVSGYSNEIKDKTNGLVLPSYAGVSDPYLFAYRDSRENLYSLPHARVGSTSPVYPLFQFKEVIENYTTFEDPFYRCMTLAGKRLTEASLVKNSSSEVNELLSRYSGQLEHCQVLIDTSKYPDPNIKRRVYLREVVEDHKKHIIENFGTNEKSKTLKSIDEFMMATAIYPPYVLKIDAEDQNVLAALYFDVEEDGRYFLDLEYSGCVPDHLPTLLQIDEEVVNRQLTRRENTSLQLGELELDEGKHVFVLSIPEGEQVLVTDEDTISSAANEHVIREAIDSILPCKAYEIGFDYLLVEGRPPTFVLTQDSDTTDLRTGEFKNKIYEEVEEDPYSNTWIRKNYTFRPDFNVKEAEVKIAAVNWDDCMAYESEEECSDPLVREQYERPSTIQIRDFSIKTRNLFTAYLKKENTQGMEFGGASLEHSKVSEASYRVSVKNQAIPYLLKFSETNHPAWNLYDSSGNRLEYEKVVVDGYANGWYINRDLPEEFYIMFELEKTLSKGVKYTITGTVVLLLLLYASKRWNLV